MKVLVPMKKLLMTTLACAAFPVLASADPAPHNWTGIYGGASAGVVSIGTVTKVDGGPYYSAPGRLNSQGGGVVAGVTAGFNFQLPKMPLVAGVEGDYSFSSAGNSGGANADNIIGQGTVMNSLGTLRARLGYSLGDNLLYATGGLAFAKVESHSVDGLVTYAAQYNEVSKRQTGWVAGAGIEHALSDHLSLKLEALYVGLGKESSVNGNGYTMTFDNNVAIVRAGSNFSFF